MNFATRPKTILDDLLSDWPVDRPRDWMARVNRPQDQNELAALRLSRDRGRPFGDDRWAAATAARLGIQSALRPVGRPKNAAAKTGQNI